MTSAAPLLLFLIAAVIYFPLTSAVPFPCSAPQARSCQSLVGYITPNQTTYAAIKTLFTIKSIRALFSANNLTPSTRPFTTVPAGTTIRVPIPCSCSAGSGSSSGRPIYVVKQGDDLDSIARNDFSGFVTYHDIAAASNISNPNVIVPGERLLIPLPCSCDPVDGLPTVHYVHLVVKGSSVASISEEFGVSSDTLLRINGIKDPKDLLAGQVLDVPLRACSSSISNSSIDRSLQVANGSYVLTANNCVRCSCSSTTWSLDCLPAQGLSKGTCPVAKCGGLFIGNTTVSACETSSCAYTGYNSSNIMTSLVKQSTCNGTTSLGPASSQVNDSGLRLQVKWFGENLLLVLHVALVTFGLLLS